MATDSAHTILLDVMGADHGPEGIIAGGIEAARLIGPAARVVLVGHRPTIDRVLAGTVNVPPAVGVLHAETEVPMTIAATDGARMRDSSVAVGLREVRERRADAFVSPGNTGAVMATALLTLGRIEGVMRPAITTMFPTSTGRPLVLLDCGANVDCKPTHLSQFAVMGSIYSSIMFNLEAPRVGLISIGEERSKGNDLVFSARKLLAASHINFVGNIEGRDILSGTDEVGVTDGFTGNILLKFAESVQPMLAKAVQRQIQTNIFSRIGAFLLLPFLRRMAKQFDYAQSGGAPLLGVDGTVIICHGSSSSLAIQNAVLAAYEMAAKGIRERIHEELLTNQLGNTNGANKSKDNRDWVVCTASAPDER